MNVCAFARIVQDCTELDSRTASMTKGDMAPENAQDEGITHGRKTGAFVFVRRD